VVGRGCRVIAVYTDPQALGRGLASKLLDAVARDAGLHHITQLELDVGVENTSAIKAYAAAGYQVVGTIPDGLNHAGYIHDQHLMVRRLPA